MLRAEGRPGQRNTKRVQPTKDPWNAPPHSLVTFPSQDQELSLPYPTTQHRIDGDNLFPHLDTSARIAYQYYILDLIVERPPIAIPILIYTQNSSEYIQFSGTSLLLVGSIRPFTSESYPSLIE